MEKVSFFLFFLSPFPLVFFLTLSLFSFSFLFFSFLFFSFFFFFSFLFFSFLFFSFLFFSFPFSRRKFRGNGKKEWEIYGFRNAKTNTFISRSHTTYKLRVPLPFPFSPFSSSSSKYLFAIYSHRAPPPLTKWNTSTSPRKNGKFLDTEWPNNRELAILWRIQGWLCCLGVLLLLCCLFGRSGEEGIRKSGWRWRMGRELMVGEGLLLVR